MNFIVRLKWEVLLEGFLARNTFECLKSKTILIGWHKKASRITLRPTCCRKCPSIRYLTKKHLPQISHIYFPVLSIFLVRSFFSEDLWIFVKCSESFDLVVYFLLQPFWVQINHILFTDWFDKCVFVMWLFRLPQSEYVFWQILHSKG